MKLISMLLASVFSWTYLVKTHRDQAIEWLAATVNEFDLTQHPLGYPPAFDKFEEGITLCERYRLSGPEFGLGDLEHFSLMAERTLRAAIKNGHIPEDGKGPEQITIWRGLYRSCKAQKVQTSHADEAMPAHA